MVQEIIPTEDTIFRGRIEKYLEGVQDSFDDQMRPQATKRADPFLCEWPNLKCLHDYPKRMVEFCIHKIDGDSSV